MISGKELLLRRNYVIELLSYLPRKGHLVWNVNKGARGRAGNIAGSKQRYSQGWRRIVRIDGHSYLAHRLIFFYMEGYWPVEVDHKDRNALNNKWNNLREITVRKDQQRNQSMHSNNKSGVTGVCYDKTYGKWIAYINEVPNKKKRLGSFENFDDAVNARRKAEKACGYDKGHGQESPYTKKEKQNED